MVKTIFYLKADKSNAAGESPIYCKIRFKNTSTTLCTGKFIQKKRWKATNGLRNHLKIKKEQAIKVFLDKVIQDIDSKFILLSKTQKNISASCIKKALTGKMMDSNEITFSEVVKSHKEIFEKKVKAGERSNATLLKYSRAADLFLEFRKKRSNNKDIQINQITSSMIYDFENYMRYETSYKGIVGIGNNSAVKYMRRLATIFNYSRKRGKININPFQNYDGKIVIKDAIFLTAEELDNIAKTNLTHSRLDKVRDIFLFSCYTGYAPIEVEHLKTRHIIKDNEGTVWINTNRIKTGIKSNVPLLPAAIRIIEKYAGIAYKDKLFPTLSSQKMNKYLKEVAAKCGIEKYLTHYVARHTFATTVTLENGISIENVSAMMGHTNINMTRHYAKVLDKNISMDMSKLHSKFK